MEQGFFVQAYKAKGPKLVGQASLAFRHVDQALSEAARIAPWRAGVVVFRQEIDGDGVQRGRPATLSIHGQVPQGWRSTERAAA